MSQLGNELGNFLFVSEKFTSIQGEGQTMGKKAIFLRLAGCNILCKSEHWVCDTIEVWKKGIATFFEDVFNKEEITKLQNNYHLIITGGEPLLHQKKIAEYLNWFQLNYGFLPTIEVETNGTIVPCKDIQIFVNYWNVSPKLENSGESFKRRFNSDAINFFNTESKTIFKFVAQDEKDMADLYNTFQEWISHEKVYLMPPGSSQEELLISRPKTIEMCLKYNFNYSERLHIVIWNQKTGV
jgi:organic radical activating enzyme